jgi:type IV pilus assembly protein PilF
MKLVPRAVGTAACALAVLTGCETTTTVNGQVVATPVVSNPTASDLKKRADVRLQLAANYYQKGQYAVALEEIQRALQSDPNSASAYGLMGLIYMDLGDRAAAETNFARSLRIDPANSETLNNYGWYLCRTQRERESLEYFQRAAANRLYTTPAMPLRNAGTCMMQVRDFKLAEEYLRRSFELDAASPASKYQLARLYLMTKQYDRAAFYYGLLEKSVDANAETLWVGVRVARGTGDVRGEKRLADELQRRFPTSREAGLLKAGMFDE